MEQNRKWHGKATFTATATAGTFTPTYPSDTWSVQLVNKSAASCVVAITALDEDGNTITMANSPFTVAATTGAEYWFDSDVTSIVLTLSSGASISGGTPLKTRVKAWRYSRNIIETANVATVTPA